VAGQNPHEFVQRHQRYDWGDLGDEDRKLNDDALSTGARIFSAYLLRSGVKIWCITEATTDDGRRASTCLTLPEEY
jgi:hypothetical protein